MRISFPLGLSLAHSIWNKCNGNNDLFLVPRCFDHLKVLWRSPVEEALRFEFAHISENYPNSSLSCLSQKSLYLLQLVHNAAVRQTNEARSHTIETC